MNIKVYLTQPEPRAKLTTYAPTAKGGSKIEAEYEATTLDGAISQAGLEIASMDEGYKQLAHLGVPEVSLSSYGEGGMSAYGDGDGVSWQAFWRHPENSGMSSCAGGKSARAALDAAVVMEAERQRSNLIDSAEYYEREARRLREILKSTEPPK